MLVLCIYSLYSLLLVKNLVKILVSKKEAFPPPFLCHVESVQELHIALLRFLVLVLVEVPVPHEKRP